MLFRSYYETNEPRGEYVLVIEGKSLLQKREELQNTWDLMTIEDHMNIYLEQGYDEKNAMKLVAKDRGVGKREIYQHLHARKEE